MSNANGWISGLVQKCGPGQYQVMRPWAKHLVWAAHATHDARTVERFGDDIFVTIATVTPSMAELMLQDAMPNRSIKPNGLAKVRRQLEQGLWIFNAMPLLFNQQGHLGDGQHRTRAGMLSRIEFDSLLVLGVSDAAIVRTVDTNIVRNAGDRLDMQNVKHARNLAACCRLVHCYLSDDYSFRSAKGVISDQEILDLATSDTRIIGAVATTAGERWTGLLTPSVAAFLRYLLSATAPADCERFLNALRIGEGGLDDGEPIAHLRQQLGNRRSRGQSVGAAATIPLVIKAWNLWRKGERIQLLRPSATFPEPV